MKSSTVGNYSPNALYILYFSLLFTAFATYSIAQTPLLIDSLHHALSKASTDTTRTRLFNALATECHRIQSDSAWDYAQKAQHLAHNISDYEEELNALKRLAILAREKGDFDVTIKYCREGIEMAKKYDFPQKAAELSLTVGLVYHFYRSDIAKGIEVYKQGIEFAKASDYHLYTAHGYAWLAYLYAVQRKVELAEAQVELALHYYKLAGASTPYDLFNNVAAGFGSFDPKRKLKYLLEGLKYTPNDPMILMNIGHTYFISKKHELAITFYKRALETFTLKPNDRAESMVYARLGSAYSELEDYELALEAFNKAIAIAKHLKVGHQEALAMTYQGIGRIKEKRKEFKEALIFYEKGIEIAKQYHSNSATEEMGGYYNIGRLHIEKFQKFELGIQKCDSALHLAIKNDNVSSQIDAYSCLQSGYDSLGRYEQALGFYRKEMSLKDSMLNIQFDTKFDSITADFRVKADIAEKDLLISKEIAHGRLTKIYASILIGGLSILCLLLILWITRRNKQKLAHKNEELAIVNQALVESNRIKDNFISSINHQFRTPMHSIVGSTALLDKEIPSALKSRVSDIKYASSHLMKLLQDILNLSELDQDNVQLKYKAFDLNNMLQNLMQQYKAAHNKPHVELHFMKSGNILSHKVWGDAPRLNQILSSLLDNAVKFTEKGVVELSADVKYISDKQVKILFEVKDTGIGIPSEKLPFIFESFSEMASVKEEQFAGSGLGLSIAKEIVALHQSKLLVETELGQGSTFFFTLQYTLADLIPPPQEYSPNILSGKRVLLVEDNLLNQKLAKKLLETQQMIVTTANNGALAVEAVQQQNFDLILMDLNMPVMDGFEATKRIKAMESTKRNIPIIALSAIVGTEVEQELSKIGMTDYMGKPFRPDEFVELLSKTLFTKKEYNEIAATIYKQTFLNE